MLILMSSFVIISVVLVVNDCIPVFKMIKNRQRKRGNLDIKRQLEVLNGNHTEQEKADAFVLLMKLSYVLVHKIINKGNKYSDRKQTEKFCKSLTPKVMARINSLEGKIG